MIRHAAKYWFYEISNEIINQYSQFGETILKEKEISRRQFKQYLWDNYNVYTYNDFIQFINKIGIKQIDKTILQYIEDEKVLKSALRLDIFKHNRETILLEQDSWSLINFIQNL
jgi:predicted N-acyltransferase